MQISNGHNSFNICNRKFHFTVEKEINQSCQLTKFIILDFSKLFYNEKPILKVNILMTGCIVPYL